MSSFLNNLVRRSAFPLVALAPSGSTFGSSGIGSAAEPKIAPQTVNPAPHALPSDVSVAPMSPVDQGDVSMPTPQAEWPHQDRAGHLDPTDSPIDRPRRRSHSGTRVDSPRGDAPASLSVDAVHVSQSDATLESRCAEPATESSEILPVAPSPNPSIATHRTQPSRLGPNPPTRHPHGTPIVSSSAVEGPQPAETGSAHEATVAPAADEDQGRHFVVRPDLNPLVSRPIISRPASASDTKSTDTVSHDDAALVPRQSSTTLHRRAVPQAVLSDPGSQAAATPMSRQTEADGRTSWTAPSEPTRSVDPNESMESIDSRRSTKSTRFAMDAPSTDLAPLSALKPKDSRSAMLAHHAVQKNQATGTPPSPPIRVHIGTIQVEAGKGRRPRRSRAVGEGFADYQRARSYDLGL